MVDPTLPAQVVWKLPNTNVWPLSFDGSFCPMTGRGSERFVIRDEVAHLRAIGATPLSFTSINKI